MRNTVAIVAIIVGAMMLYSAVTDKSVRNVIRLSIGQPEVESENGGGTTDPVGSAIDGANKAQSDAQAQTGTGEGGVGGGGGGGGNGGGGSF